LSKKMLIDDKENDDRQIIIDADRKQRELSTLVANKENDYLLTRMEWFSMNKIVIIEDVEIDR